MNFGDAGLKQAFKRMYAQLRPGGVLVLEPQGWSSYGKKKNLTVSITLLISKNIFLHCTMLEIHKSSFLLKERIYKNYQSIEFRPHSFTQYLLSTEVGFSKCEVLSIPPHPSKGFQRPIHLFTKAGSSQDTSDDSAKNTSNRQERKDEARRKLEQKEYEQKLFKKEESKEGNMSEISQQSNESMSQYDQLENVYAPSATPCYDTPGYNSDNQPPDASKMCYLDVNIEGDKAEADSQVEANVPPTVSTFENKTTENQTTRKRNLETDDVKAIDTKKSRKVDEMSRSITNENRKTAEVKQEKVSQESISAKESKSKVDQTKDNESNTQSTTKDEQSSSHLNERTNVEESKEDLKTKEWKEPESGSRSPCEKEQTERQCCELTSDNT